jgi:hypothetical protein
VYYNVLTYVSYVEKTRPGNFLPYANLVAMGQQKRLATYERTDSTLPGVRFGWLYQVLKLGNGFISILLYNMLGRGWLVPQGPGG